MFRQFDEVAVRSDIDCSYLTIIQVSETRQSRGRWACSGGIRAGAEDFINSDPAR